MNPLLQQVAIAAGALAVGLLIGLLTNRARLERARTREEETAERLQAELAVQKVQIADLKARVAAFEGKGSRPIEREADGSLAVPRQDEPLAPSPPTRAYSLRKQTSDPARSQR